MKWEWEGNTKKQSKGNDDFSHQIIYIVILIKSIDRVIILEYKNAEQSTNKCKRQN